MISVPTDWQDYELIDTGEGEKLERWGQYVMARPDPRIIWGRGDQGSWTKAGAVFRNDKWEFKNKPPEKWRITYGQLRFAFTTN